MAEVTRMDMHVHSKYSTNPSQWVLKKLGCSESYTEPEFIYKRLKEKGMDLVTITDHDRIQACLDIAHLPGTFISQEVTAVFPEDGCKIHILTYNINQELYSEIQYLKSDIYALARYLDKNRIAHAVAHPFFSVNGKLDYQHFEKLLLLFKTFECNGAREESLNSGLRFILNHLCPKDFEYLENKHGFKALGNRPWEKSLTGGSDDHSSLNIGRMFTEVPGQCGIEDFLDRIRQGRSEARGMASTPKTMAHNLYAIGYQYCKTRFNLSKYTRRDSFLGFMDMALNPGQQNSRKSLADKIMSFLNTMKNSRPAYGGKGIHQVLSLETEKLIRTDPEIKKIVNAPLNRHEHMGAKWFRFAGKAGNRLLSDSLQKVLQQAASPGFLNVFQTLASAGSLYTMLSPYFLSYSMFHQDRMLSRDFLNKFRENKKISTLKNEMKVAHFTDTFYEVNGVAITLQQQARLAVKNNKDLTVITCRPQELQQECPAKVKNFHPIGVFELPEYPEIKLYYPPFLEMLDYCFEKRITHIHTATPGPIGLAALAVSRLLDLPAFGTYHTSLPQYAGYLTGDHALEALMWRYMVWYYNQLNTVFAPSSATASELASKGINREKICCYPRGVDTIRFNPAKKNGFFARNFGIRDEIKLLYVGRVSKEKNLPVLEKAFKQVCSVTENVHLIVVGEGPYRYEMEYSLKDYPATFTGYLKGEDLTQAYASADLFVFPSSTDTFGNVVLEAQASGLPVIVVNQGGPMENVVDCKTGYVIPANDCQALRETINLLVNNPEGRLNMGREARKYMESRSFEKCFQKTWEIFARSA